MNEHGKIVRRDEKEKRWAANKLRREARDGHLNKVWQSTMPRTH